MKVTLSHYSVPFYVHRWQHAFAHECRRCLRTDHSRQQSHRGVRKGVDAAHFSIANPPSVATYRTVATRDRATDGMWKSAVTRFVVLETFNDGWREDPGGNCSSTRRAAVLGSAPEFGANAKGIGVLTAVEGIETAIDLRLELG